MPTIFLKSLRNNFSIIILVVTLIGLCGIRFYKLDVYPRGFFVDEASVAYNAQSIAETGKDEYGILFPIYFKAFGEYKNPILVYSQAVLFSFLQPTIYTARLVPALWGVVFLFLVWIYTKQDSNSLRLIKILLAATTPWLFHLSRINFEVIVFPVLVFASLIPLRKYASQAKTKNWLQFVLLMSISFYSYTAARVLVPLILMLAGILLILVKRSKAFQPLVLGALLATLIVTPAVLWNIYYPNSLIARYEIVGKTDEPISRQLKNIALRYREHTRLSYLFEVGDENLRHNTGKGLLPLITLPLFFLGLCKFWQNKKNYYNWFILGGLVLSPLPGALTWDGVPHALRSILFVVFYLLIVFAGLDWIKQLKYAGRWLMIITLILVVEFLSYWAHYKSVYQTTNYKWFFVGDIEEITTLHEQKKNFVVAETTFFGTYATAAFLYNYPPQLFQQVKQGHETKVVEYIEKNK